MKILVLSLLFAVTGFSVDVTSGFPNGHYVGEGVWQDNGGRQVSYLSHVEFIDNEMRLEYAWENGSLSIVLTVLFNDEGQIEVIYGDEWVGSGYCAIDQCHYEVDVDGVHVEEDLRFTDIGLNISGSKTIGDRIISWQEELYLQSTEGGGCADPSTPEA